MSEQEEDVIIESDGSEELGESDEDLGASEARADTKLAKLRKELEQCRKEKQEHLNGWQRAKADYVNALKRFEEEKKQAVEIGKIVTVSAFIPAIDSLERAQATAALPDGFAGIAKQLDQAADSLGLTRFGEVGEKFNPFLHEALGQDVAESETQDDTISAVLELGWKIGESVIRPAKVRVAHVA